MTNKRIALFIDLLFLLALLPIMFKLLPIERWLVKNSIFVYVLISWLYVVYFMNRVVTMPLLLKKNKRLFWALIILGLTAAGTWLITQYQLAIPIGKLDKVRSMAQNSPRLRLQHQAVWFLFVIVTTFSMAVGLLNELHRQVLARQAVELEKKKAELEFYKAQINPHFLFNTLNTLYGLLIMGSEHTETAFMQFINLMKYIYSNGSKDQIPVQTEVQYIQHFIELQKYRTPPNTQILFSYEHDETEHLLIAPLLLITFVENAFKYGISSVSSGNIQIVLRAKNNELFFSVENPVFNNESQTSSNGIGIVNCKKRLALLYPNRHNLCIEETDNSHIVTLSIKLIA